MFLFINVLLNQNILVYFSLLPPNLKHFAFINFILKFKIKLQISNFTWWVLGLRLCTLL